MNITQGNNGSYSHQGVNTLDLAGYKGGCSPLYAPFDVVCVGVDGPDLGNAVFWQSQNKVRFVDGTIDYATIMIIHDNNLDGIRVGVKYSQGTQIANAGTAGRATGNHNHFEIAKGKFTHKYDLNQKTKVYHLPNSISADKCCFVNKTDIINGNNMKWKYL
ncbi:M23 family metallopeptidase [[Clostridium] innocuum]|uniref:M23 family metallopeptidase n=1 Tax=Clostridium innocuum TaxID=1522 RepID=UPI003259FF37